MSDAKKIVPLRNKKQTCESSQRRNYDYLKQNKATISSEMLEARLQLLEKNYQDYRTNHFRIMSEFPSDQEIKDKEDFEDEYVMIKAMILSLKDIPEDNPRNNNFRPKNIHVPVISLPTFSGKYTEWVSFWNTFTTLVDQTRLDVIEKFQHLKNCLKEPASLVITGLEISPQNYEIAKQNLIDRYSNKRISFQAHIREIINLPCVQKNSAENLHHLVDSINVHYNALLSIGSKDELAEALLLNLVFAKLDSSTYTKWEETAASTNDVPSWKKLKEFLDMRCQALDNISSNSIPKSSSNQQQNKATNRPNPRNVTLASSSNACIYCKKKNHSIFKCFKFRDLPGEIKLKEIAELKLCPNCLKSLHPDQSCQSTDKCHMCKQAHHTLLHEAYALKISSQEEANKEQPSTSKVSANVANKSSQIVLATAIVRVKDAFGRFVDCRALLDSASQTHFMSSNLANRLNLRKHKVNIPIGGIGDVSTTVKHKVSASISSNYKSFEANLEFLLLPVITDNQPTKPINVNALKIPAQCTLADPEFSISQPVDILLGAEVFYNLLCSGRIQLGDNLPTLQETVFGYVLSGQITKSISLSTFIINDNSQDNQEENLNEILEKFWKIEEIDSPEKHLSPEEVACENHYKENVKLENNKFTVKLPFKEDPSCLGNSSYSAFQQFLSLERKLEKDTQLKENYKNFLEEYENLGHMKLVAEDEVSKVRYIMPHHCVIRPDSSSTKLRVVFNASHQTTSKKSLNDCLMVGATIQPDLFSIVLRFRFFRYVFKCDITKMYRQVEVFDEDSFYQCIFWRNKPSLPISIYRLLTVTYGTAAAPHLAIRTLVELAIRFAKQFPRAAEALLKAFYVDDCLWGGETIEEVIAIMKELIELLKLGGFELRKFGSNAPEIIKDVPQNDRETLIQLGDEGMVKTLGIAWQPESDHILFDYKGTPQHSKITKRIVLSEIGKLFDILGLACPVIILGKMFMQDLWKRKLDWDESLPDSLCQQWKIFHTELSILNQLRIPRFVLSSQENVIVELHGFSDASIDAYGCCLYTRCIDHNGNISVSLVCAKSKVAPVKTQTPTRLELCGALLLSELMSNFRSIVDFQFKQVFCWTDSETVLHWLSQHPSTWTTFVANRVSKIQQLTSPIIWQYVNTSDNPADIASRGMLPSKLIKSQLWFEGPAFLKQSPEHWPLYFTEIDPDKIPDRRKVRPIIAHLANNPEEDPVASSKLANDFSRLQLQFVYVNRFINNCRNSARGHPLVTGELSIAERNSAMHTIYKFVQASSFAPEIDLLSHNKIVKSQIKYLNPFLDEGLLKVGGRLSKANVPETTKNQILLPKFHPFTHTLIRHFHFRHCHAGPQALMAILREKYWIVNAREVIQKVLRKCLICYRHRPTMFKQIMGSLPKHRVEPARPFIHSGVDYGPFFLTHRLRGRPLYKCYIAIFVCFSTKAVHIEVVPDLTTDAFLRALKRFIGRRGFVKSLYSDNATNFVGAKRQLEKSFISLFIDIQAKNISAKELADFKQLLNSPEHQTMVQKICAEDNIEFKNIPAGSPHFGGLWEAAVKSAKTLLVKVLGDANLTYEEFETLVIQVESTLNSRPLIPMSSDPNDLSTLTPGHFLIGEPLTTLVEPDTKELKILPTDRYNYLCSLYHHFWNRWNKEYLVQLQQRAKWTQPSTNVQIHQIVLIKEDNIPPQKWQIGRVISVHPGNDGKVRVATVKTKFGTYKRAIVNLAPLPLD